MLFGCSRFIVKTKYLSTKLQHYPDILYEWSTHISRLTITEYVLNYLFYMYMLFPRWLKDIKSLYLH